MTWLYHQSFHSPMCFLQSPPRLPWSFPGACMPCWKSCRQTLNADMLRLLCASPVRQSSCNSGVSSLLKALQLLGLAREHKAVGNTPLNLICSLSTSSMRTGTSVLVFSFNQAWRCCWPQTNFWTSTRVWAKCFLLFFREASVGGSATGALNHSRN